MSTLPYVWDENMQFIIFIIRADKHKQSSPAITDGREKTEILIVPPLSLNPTVLPPPPPPVERAVEMTYFYPPLFT